MAPCRNGTMQMRLAKNDEVIEGFVFYTLSPNFCDGIQI